MIKKKEPKTLKQICFEALPNLMTSHIRKLVHKTDASEWFLKFYGQANVDRDDILNKQVSILHDFIYSQVIWYDYEKMFTTLLLSVEAAVTSAREKYSTKTDLASYHEDVESMSKFSEIVACPRMRRLDFTLVPKSLRSRVIELLGSFTYLKVLVLGGSTGGQWPLKHIMQKLTKSLEELHFLEEFTMKQDCSPAILEVLTRQCNNGLVKLDVECSKHVDDTCLPFILKCQNLTELGVFKTGLSDESLARLIMGLPNLTSLPRGDFLCDALGWIDYLEEIDNPIFLIKDFFPSQSYYFHEAWQLELASRMCPFISKMLFIFHETCVPDYTVLHAFEHLREVDLYGGSFFGDKISEFLEIRGKKLTKITFISVKEINYKSIALLSVHCPKLLSLSFNHCEMSEFRPNGDPNSDAEYDRRQSFLAMARDAFELMTKFEKIENLSILSTCSTIHLRMLMSHCPNVKQIHLGSHTSIDDELMSKVLSRNPMSHLEEFHCDRALRLGLVTFNLLINQCEELRAVGDLQNWGGVDPADVGRLREMTHRQNLALDLRSHQKIRKFVEMREFERKTYFNLVSGPSIERMRMAERGGGYPAH